LSNYLVELKKVRTGSDFTDVSTKLEAFLKTAFDFKYSDVFNRINRFTTWELSLAGLIGLVEGLIAKHSLAVVSDDIKNIKQNFTPMNEEDKKVFIVHGRDREAKETLARFLEKIGLEAVILHEQPNSGRTIIEKFEIYSDVSFAIVLLTPDDVGSLLEEPNSSKHRARQNVILELGYFVGKLGRMNVCALNKANVEIPSDLHGILYIDFDESGAWKTKLAQELIQAKLEVKLDGLLK